MASYAILLGAHAAPTPSSILRQPPLGGNIPVPSLDDLPYTDIDPGVFDNEIVKLRAGKPPPKASPPPAGPRLPGRLPRPGGSLPGGLPLPGYRQDPEGSPIPGYSPLKGSLPSSGDLPEQDTSPAQPAPEPPSARYQVENGTYDGTQAALTHIYGRMEKSWEAYFNVLKIESTLPTPMGLDEQKQIYRWSAYPKDASPASGLVYPPHLDVVPPVDEEWQTRIFNNLGLGETALMLSDLVPTSWIGKKAKELAEKIFEAANGSVYGICSEKPTIAAYHAYNKVHTKKPTDVLAGANLGQLDDWFSDRRFAEQSFTGPNPVTIERIGDDLLAEFVETARRDDVDHWKTELDEIPRDSLFVQDCRYFREATGAEPDAELHHENGGDDNWACAAVTLFRLHEDGKLHPVAIVCDYRGSMAGSVTIFNKRTAPSAASPKEEESDWPWRYAKTCAQVSDWIRHEVGIHLTRAHLIEEAVIVATNRCVPMTHSVYRLLKPHWVRTLSLNAAARKTLVPEVVAGLVGIDMEAVYSLIRHEYEHFDFVQSYVPNDLERRGFPNTLDELRGDPKYKNYAYAIDVLRMWEILGDYVTGVVNADFPDDAAVSGDCFIRDWCYEIKQYGRIATFPNVTTRAELADAITMCIHIAAPFHTAVNYLQNFYQAFVITKPAALCKAPPANLAELQGYTEKDLTEALPIGRLHQWLLSVQLPWLLSFKVEDKSNLLNFAASQARAYAGDDEATAKKRDAATKLFTDLCGFVEEVNSTSRNMDEDSVPYTVLDPSSTAVSILI